MTNDLKKRLERVFATGDLKMLELLINDGLMEIDIYQTVCGLIRDWSMKRSEGMDILPGEYEYSEDVLIKLVDTLVSNGLDVNHPIDDSGDHPNLFWGIMNFQTYPKLLEYLIAKGSELNFRNDYGSILNSYFINVELDAISGYADLGRCTNEGCKLAIYHGALPLHLMERQNLDYKGEIKPEEFEIIDAVLSLDYEFFNSRDKNFLDDGDALHHLISLARYACPKDVFAPTKEFQEALLRIALCIMEKTSYNLGQWLTFECFSQNLEYLIIGLLQTGNKDLIWDIGLGIKRYGELMEPESFARVSTVYNIITAADGLQ